MNPAPRPVDVEALLEQREAVLRLALRLVRDPHRAEDVAQSAMLTALQQGGRARHGIGPWLRGVTRNLAARIARTEVRGRERERRAARPESVPATEELVVRIAEQRRVLGHLEALEEPYRTVVLLRYFEDLPPRQIATVVKAPVATVKSQLHRGLARLRERMDADHGGRRTPWAVALVPALGRAGAMHVATLATAWSIIVGIKHYALAAGGILLIAALGVWQLRNDPGISRDDPSDASDVRTAAAPIEDPTLEGRAVGESEEPSARASTWSVAGRVVTSAGEPAPGIPILLWQQPTRRDHGGNDVGEFDRAWRPSAEGQAPLATGASDGDGRFRIEAEPGATWVIVEARPPPPRLGTSRYVPVRRAHETDVELLVATGTELRGRVVGADGEGVRASIELSMLSAPELGGLRSRYERRGLGTDASGRFVAEAVPNGKLSVMVHVPGRVRRTYAVNVPREEEVVFRLVEAGAVRVAGTVRDKDGSPIAGARVVVDLRAQADASRVQAMATTDAHGAYTCSGLPAGALRVVVFDAAGFRPGRFRGNDRPLAAGAALEVDMVLRRGVSLEGWVRTKDGTPVEGATVRVGAHEPSTSSHWGATTDAEGHYFIAGLPSEGHAGVRVDRDGLYQPAQTDGRAEGAAPTVLAVSLGADESVHTLDIVLVPGVPVAGRTVTRDGAPVGGARVTLTPTTEQLPQGLLNYLYLAPTDFQARSDAAGSFRFPGLPPGMRWTAQASKGELLSPLVEDYETTFTPPPEPLDLVLESGAVVEGVVVDPTGTPIPGLSVYVCIGDRSDWTASGLGGRFRFAGLPAGAYRVEVGTGRRNLVAEPVEVALGAGDRISDLRIVTRPPLLTTGRILAADGSPLTHGRARLQHAFDRSPTGGTTLDTDAAGRFEIRRWKPGSYRVCVGQRQAGDVFELGARDLELRLGRVQRASVTIRILDPEGEPVPKCRLMVMTGNAQGKSGSYHTVDGGVYLLRTAALDQETDLTVSDAVDAEGKPLNVVGAYLHDIDTNRAEIVVSLEAGRTLAGLVVGPDGRPVPDVTISVPGPDGIPYGPSRTRTDAEGRFSLSGLPSTALTLTAKSDGPWLPFTVEVAAGTAEVRIELERGASFVVDVVGPAGRPVEGVNVSVQASGPPSAWRRRGKTDEQGRFRAQGVPAGVLLRIDLDTREAERVLPSTRRDEVSPEPGKIRIALAAPRWIEGVVVDPDGEPVGEARVRADGKSEPTAFAVRLRTTSDAETGRFRLGPLEEGTYRVVASGGRSRGLVEIGQVLVRSPSTDARLVLPRGTEIEGRLHVSDVKGWSLCWQVGTRAWAANLGPRGHFRIDRVADLVGALCAWGPGGFYALIEDVRPGDGPFDLRPVKGGHIAGRFDPAGARKGPYFAGARRDALHFGGQVQGDGSFVIEGLPPGAWRVAIFANGVEVAALEGVEPDGEPILLRAKQAVGDR